MKQIIFRRLTVTDFKGISKQEVDFSDGVTVIIGVNRSGKTSLLDALYWVLFGKSLLGETRFGVIPIDKLSAIPCVELIIEVDGEEHTLTRKLIKGGATDCMIDGVPTQVRDYEGWVNLNIMQIDRFKLFSNPLYFSSLAWKEQRELFTSFFENLSKDDVIALMKREDVKLSDGFLDLIGKMGPEDIQEKMKREIKELDTQKTKGQAVADHLTEEIREAKSVSVAALEKERAELTKKWDKAEEKAKEREEAQKPREEARRKLRELHDEAEDIKADIRKAARDKETKVYELERLVSDTEAKMKRKSDEWKREEAREISTVCPTCGQDFPKDRVSAGEEAKKKVLGDIEAEGKALREELNDYKAELKKAEAIEFKDLESQFAEKQTEVSKQKAIVERLESACLPTAEPVHEMRVRIDDIGVLLAEAGKIKDKTAERDGLIKTIEKTAREIELRERIQKDAGEYIFYQAQATVEAVNTQFDKVKIELFEYQKNGINKPTFKLLYDGVNFQDTSSTERVLIGLEINEYLKKALSVSVPTIIDNFESYKSIQFETLPKQSIVSVVNEDSANICVESI